jgi:hypothetical protein
MDQHSKHPKVSSRSLDLALIMAMAVMVRKLQTLISTSQLSCSTTSSYYERVISCHGHVVRLFLARSLAFFMCVGLTMIMAMVL